MEELVGTEEGGEEGVPGFGVFADVVESYDAEVGYFRVLYEDGDSEEVDLGEMAAILVGPPMLPLPQQPWEAVGRRPKKQRRADEESPQADGVVVVEAAAGGGLSNGAGPTTPAETIRAEAKGEVMAQKKQRVSPRPDSARPHRRSARQAKTTALAAEMEAAAAAAVAEAEATASAISQQSGRKRRCANGSGRYQSVARDVEAAAKARAATVIAGFGLEGLPVLDVFQVLVGMGFRSMRIMRVKNLNLYAFGLYIQPDSICKKLGPKYASVPVAQLKDHPDFYEDLLRENIHMTVRLVVSYNGLSIGTVREENIHMTVRLVVSYNGLSIGTVRDAFEKSLCFRLQKMNPNTDYRCLKTFGSYFSEDIRIPAGTKIDFRQTSDGQLITES